MKKRTHSPQQLSFNFDVQNNPTNISNAYTSQIAEMYSAPLKQYDPPPLLPWLIIALLAFFLLFAIQVWGEKKQNFRHEPKQLKLWPE